MVALAEMTAATSVFTSRPLTAVFAGATSGIGESTVRALCERSTSNDHALRIFLLGRNATSAQKVIDDCVAICSKAQLSFVQVNDMRLLKDVDSACTELKKILSGDAVDLLVMSQGQISFSGRQDTKEGLDASMSLLYYSRMRLIINLLPNLLLSSVPTGAHVLSIYAAGLESYGRLDQNNLSLFEPGNYSFARARTHVVAMKTMFFERLAQQYPGKLAFAHIYPGLVVTPAFNNPSFPAWFKVAWKLARPFAGLVGTGIDEIGHRVLYFCTERFPARSTAGDQAVNATGVAMSTDGVRGGGAYSVSYTGKVCDVQQYYEKLRGENFHTEGFREKAWRHTNIVFTKIEGEGFFAE